MSCQENYCNQDEACLNYCWDHVPRTKMRECIELLRERMAIQYTVGAVDGCFDRLCPGCAGRDARS